MQSPHILFHPLKHHLATLRAFVRQPHKAALAANIAQLKTLGASQFDMYTGEYDLVQIKNGIADKLNSLDITSEEAYRQWVMAKGGFQTIALPDKSDWTLRYLHRNDFVHLHPSRHSPGTLRIKANAMKSVAAYLLLEPATGLNIQRLNVIRKEWLQLPPVTAEGNYDELRKVYQLLTNP